MSAGGLRTRRQLQWLCMVCVNILNSSVLQLASAVCVVVVFMGSRKYPKPNDWDMFVKGNGGNSNARTDLEAVCFFSLTCSKNLPYWRLHTFNRF